jgi:phospholipid-binding lipoprotein MlaA
MKSIRELVPLLMLVSIVGLTGCASTPEEENLTPPRRTFEFVERPDDMLLNDPIEPFNRLMYNFNARFDRYVFLPVVSGYKWIMPGPAEKGVSNFLSNVREPVYLVNNVLQFKIKNSGITLSRFIINSTVGLAGLFDPATKWGLYRRKEDFGQTLGKWGIGPGPYLVLPLLGPSNLRDATGLVADSALEYNIDLFNTKNDANRDHIRYSLMLLRAIDTRKNTAFRYFETGTPFEYELVRYAFTEVRKEMIAK